MTLPKSWLGNSKLYIGSLGLILIYDNWLDTRFSTGLVLFSQQFWNVSLAYNTIYDLLQSTGSFFHDKSVTLGSLIGVSRILELSRRSLRGRKTEPSKEKKSTKSRIWFFCLCLRPANADTKRVKNPPSLRHFLDAERKAADEYRRNQNSNTIGPDEIGMAHEPFTEPNSLFVDGRIAPPQSSSGNSVSDAKRGKLRGLEHGNGFGVASLFPCMCMCGQPSDH